MELLDEVKGWNIYGMRGENSNFRFILNSTHYRPENKELYNNDTGQQN